VEKAVALIKCEECGNDISSKAVSCPKCGAPNPSTQQPATGFVRGSSEDLAHRTKTKIIGVLVVLFALIYSFWPSGESRRTGGEKTAPTAASTATRQSTVENYRLADEEDVRQAESFLARLPPACKADSQAAASPDGSITIVVVCADGYNSYNGTVEIKGGRVRKVQEH